MSVDIMHSINFAWKGYHGWGLINTETSFIPHLTFKVQYKEMEGTNM